MGVVDTLLSILRDNRSIQKEQRTEIANYLRKIAKCCDDFRIALRRIYRNEEQISSFDLFDDLQRPVDRIAGYYNFIDNVLGSRVRSELLDEIAVSIAMVMKIEVSILYDLPKDSYPAIAERVSRARRQFTNLYGNVCIVYRSSKRPKIEMCGEIQTVEDYLSHLSVLQTKLEVLADSVDAGTDPR